MSKFIHLSLSLSFSRPPKKHLTRILYFTRLSGSFGRQSHGPSSLLLLRINFHAPLHSILTFHRRKLCHQQHRHTFDTQAKGTHSSRTPLYSSLAPSSSFFLSLLTQKHIERSNCLRPLLQLTYTFNLFHFLHLQLLSS